MSHDYDVIVPESRWPSAKAFQTALDADGGTVKLQGINDWDKPTPVNWEPEFPVTLNGEPVGFEVYVYQILTRTDGERTGKSELIESMDEHGMDSSLVVDGSYVFSVALRHGDDEWESARQLMSALTRHFDGYGFEFQAGTFGGADWAKSLGETLDAGKQEYDRIVQEMAARPANNPQSVNSDSFWSRLTGFFK